MRKNCVIRKCQCSEKLMARADYSTIGMGIEGDRIFLTPNGGWFPLECPFCGEVGTILFTTEEFNEIKN